MNSQSSSNEQENPLDSSFATEQQFVKLEEEEDKEELPFFGSQSFLLKQSTPQKKQLKTKVNKEIAIKNRESNRLPEDAMLDNWMDMESAAPLTQSPMLMSQREITIVTAPQSL